MLLLLFSLLFHFPLDSIIRILADSESTMIWLIRNAAHLWLYDFMILDCYFLLSLKDRLGGSFNYIHPSNRKRSSRQQPPSYRVSALD